jgi:hypothetical protein
VKTTGNGKSNAHHGGSGNNTLICYFEGDFYVLALMPAWWSLSRTMLCYFEMIVE